MKKRFKKFHYCCFLIGLVFMVCLILLASSSVSFAKDKNNSLTLQFNGGTEFVFGNSKGEPLTVKLPGQIDKELTVTHQDGGSGFVNLMERIGIKANAVINPIKTVADPLVAKLAGEFKEGVSYSY